VFAEALMDGEIVIDGEIEIVCEIEGEIVIEGEIEIDPEIEIEFDADTCAFTIDTPTSKIVRIKKSFIFLRVDICVVFVV